MSPPAPASRVDANKRCGGVAVRAGLRSHTIPELFKTGLPLQYIYIPTRTYETLISNRQNKVAITFILNKRWLQTG